MADGAPSLVEYVRVNLKNLAGIASWVVISGGLIMYNKFILARYGFSYPITLTIWHQILCALLAMLFIDVLKIVEKPVMDHQTYKTKIIPIGALMAGTLWLGNTAYLYLSVSFIQMLKALMPASVYLHGLVYGVETGFAPRKFGAILVICGGVLLASLGEIEFSVIGTIYQLASISSESNRLIISQLLLQNSVLKLNPITTLYYVAPICACFLLLVWMVLEMNDLLGMSLDSCVQTERMSSYLSQFSYAVSGKCLKFDPQLLKDEYRHWPLYVHIFIFLSNGIMAFVLNCVVYFIIRGTSALTMNIAGPCKDILLVFLSSVVFGNIVVSQEYVGFGIALLGIALYNYVKLMKL